MLILEQTDRQTDKNTFTLTDNRQLEQLDRFTIVWTHRDNKDK